jgi:hypothetical protein
MMNIETVNRCIDLQLDELDDLFDEIKGDVRDGIEGLDMKAVFQHVEDRYELIELLRGKKAALMTAAVPVKKSNKNK